MRILGGNDVRFERSANGTLSCSLKNGEKHPQVHCIALFPLSNPGSFISVAEEKEHDLEEIGILGDLRDFDDGQRRMIEESAAERYFVPELSDMRKISSKQGRKGAGLCELEISTDRGPRIIHIFNPRENISVSGSGVVLITDIEKNRYRISNPDRLPEGARRTLDSIML